jgi:hypothetical protein
MEREWNGRRGEWDGRIWRLEREWDGGSGVLGRLGHADRNPYAVVLGMTIPNNITSVVLDITTSAAGGSDFGTPTTATLSQ